eukprot:10548315-Alexandrium_andersonii.AAC.1
MRRASASEMRTARMGTSSAPAASPDDPAAGRAGAAPLGAVAPGPSASSPGPLLVGGSDTTPA